MASLSPAEPMARKAQRGCPEEERLLAEEEEEEELPSRGTGLTVLLPGSPRRMSMEEGPTQKTTKKILQTASP